MCKNKRKTSNRLLAAFLSLVMLFSILPIDSLTALAATQEHPGAVTITVKDEDGVPVKDASVVYTIDSTTNDDAYKEGTLTTDENGAVEVMESTAFEENDLKISASITAEGYAEGTLKEAEIISAEQNFEVTIISTTIKDVTVEAKNLTYNGEFQELVSVTEIEGDTVTYQLDGEEASNDVPTKKDVGEYPVTVTVKREGKEDLVTKVTAKIDPADITDISIEGVNIEYNGNLQEIVKLNGSFEENDIVTWTVNSDSRAGKNIPEETAVGSYNVTLTVGRANYNRLTTETVSSEITEGTLELGDIKVTGLQGVYTVEDGNPVAQPAVTVENLGDYELKYQLDDGDTTVDEYAWADEIPTVTDAGSYIVWVKAVKTGYNDQDVTVQPAESAVAPYNVYIAKAEQTFAFENYSAMEDAADPEKIELKGSIPYESGNTYKFAAVDEASLAGGTITYEITADEQSADISEAGLLTVKRPGAITVTAKLSGNQNYNECEIRYYLEVTGVVAEKGDYIGFAESEKTFTLGTSETISEQEADKRDPLIAGDLTYSINDMNGISIDENSGKLTVTDLEALTKEVRLENKEIVVTARKASTDLYGEDEASYKVKLAFETAPENPYTLSDPDGTNDWYKTKATVTPAEGYTIAQKPSESFTASTDFSDQGTEVRHVYLKNENTGGITDRIPVNIKIDSKTPEDLTIEYSELNLIQKIVGNIGFYNPTVTITFTAKDVTSGIDHFDWTYTPEDGEPVTKEITVTVQENTATATLTLPADQAEQLHGKISFTATDKAGNEIGKRDEYVFIVDTIAPELSVKYQGEEPYTAQEAVYQGAHFFNSDVNVELTVTETNFYPEDVVVKVSKDGGAATPVTPSWNDKVGTFTLAGDGDYVVYVTYTDKADNKMTDYASETITVDKTAPIVKIDYIHDGDVQKTRFTVTEHNFRASDLVITGTMKDINDKDVAFTAAKLTEILHEAAWSKNGDVYTYEYDQYVNGIYQLKADYKDISGWDAVQFAADEFIIDHEAPSEPVVEYITTPWNKFLNVITFGYYNPSVKVRFSAYDTSSGVETFTWGYTKQTGASTVKHPEMLADTNISAIQDRTDRSKFTAEITMTADQAAQYRGYLSVQATDKFQNKSVKKADNGNIIVVDTISPKISVEYTDADRTIGKEYYYNNAVEAKFTVTEANFYAEDVKVTVTKNGQKFNYGTVKWGTRNEKDMTIGTLTLPAPADHSGDGHYVITVEYTDRSNNEMVKYVSATHTIDTTKPVIDVAYQNKNAANTLTDRDGHERKYFENTQTAVVTVKEHNFIAEEVDFMITAKDVTGAEFEADKWYSMSKWNTDGDVHTITITYPGDANYSFDVAYTDNAKNEADDYAVDYFTVDKTAPENLEVDYSTSVLDTVLESVTFGFYNAKMTVTLSAEDPVSEVHSFTYSYLNASGVSKVNAELIDKVLEGAEIQYSADRKKAVTTFEIPKLALGNDNQFNGTVKFTAVDRAGNRTDEHKETKRIVVDNIAPTAEVTYNEATNVEDGISYYNGDITATVTIDEANFYAEDVQVMVTKDDGAATAVTPTWEDLSVDIHEGTFILTEDGDYTVTINYMDKSSNEMETYTSEQMTIDTEIEVPTYTINGVPKTEIGGAYKEEATIGFNFADQNFDTTEITLTRTRFDKVEDVTETFIKVADDEKGGSGSFTIPTEVANDGIYELKISMTDKAKHEAESEMKFTINRYGSVYEYSDELVALIKDGGQYTQSVDKDLVITEYNADQINEDSVNILVTRDGETVDADFSSDPEKIDSQAVLSENGWYQYRYTIKTSTFEKDGVYKISLASAYDTDDAKENESTSVPENSITASGEEILDTMTFTVDSVAPEIRNIVNLDKAIADVDKIVDGKLNIKYTIVDVGGLKNIEIIVNGKTIQNLTEEEIADDLYNFTGSFDLEEQDGTTAHRIQIKVTDLAGNVTDTDSEEFLQAHSEDNEDSTFVFFNEVTVSRNFFVRWYANKPLFWGVIGGAAVLVTGIASLIAFKRKKKDEEK